MFKTLRNRSIKNEKGMEAIQAIFIIPLLFYFGVMAINLVSGQIINWRLQAIVKIAATEAAIQGGDVVTPGMPDMPGVSSISGAGLTPSAWLASSVEAYAGVETVISAGCTTPASAGEIGVCSINYVPLVIIGSPPGLDLGAPRTVTREYVALHAPNCNLAGAAC